MSELNTSITLPAGEMSSPRRRSLLAFASSIVLIVGGARAGQGDTDNSIETRITEVRVQLLSAEITRFQRPLREGVNKRGVEYREALVLRVAVEREAFDSLPPNIEPFLYVGRNEYRVFHIDRDDQQRLDLPVRHRTGPGRRRRGHSDNTIR